MTEEEWLRSESFDQVVLPLREVENRRKWRLFAVACVRRIWHLVPEEYRHAVNVAERFAERRSTREELASAWAMYRWGLNAAELAACWASCPTGDVIVRASESVPRYAAAAVRGDDGEGPERTLWRDFIAYARDVFGNPYRPAR